MKLLVLLVVNVAAFSVSASTLGEKWTEISRPSVIFTGDRYQKFERHVPVYVDIHSGLDKPLNTSDVTYYENLKLKLSSGSVIDSDLFTMRQHSSEGLFRQSSVTYLVKPIKTGGQDITFDSSISLFVGGSKKETKSFTINILTSEDHQTLTTADVTSEAMKCISPDIINEQSLNCVDHEGEYVGYLQWADLQRLMDRFHQQSGIVRTATDWYFEFINLPLR